ncbi:MAG: FAD-dependent oxidoreductase [Verrucomicrobiales bacterium]
MPSKLLKQLSVFSLSTLSVLGAEKYDLVVYGGTSAGITAGLQALKMGKSVVVIEPTKRIGGLTTGGLGQTDIGNKHVIGGLSREFYQRISQHYAEDSAWNWQKREQYKDSGQTRTRKGEDTMWTFEPSAALKVYQDWIDEHQLKIVYQQRLDRSEGGVSKEGGRIASIRMESGEEYEGKFFIDATYEGDLFAAAGVSYHVGREAGDKYDESLNGVRTAMNKHHNFVKGVDPYKVKGDPESGLLPFIDPKGPGEEGSGDHRVQAYCFRMCLTDHPENRIPFHKPEGYNEEWYELLLRNFEAGEKGIPWINSSMPNRKTDTNNRTGFSTDFIGQNYDYPEASYEEREKIVARHLLYQQGLMWTLANHPRVPEHIRKGVSRWGMSKDEFTEGNGWQEQLYIREGRRMVGSMVMTQNHCQHKIPVEDSVGMGAYTMDSHNVQRYVDENGHVRNEGDIQVGGFPPYPISYHALVPKKEECTNLLVPVSLSASHMAFGSIRMEPVFMVLGQSAATAAALAIDKDIEAIQDLPYEPLKERMIADKQILVYEGNPNADRPKAKDFKGIVVDDRDAKTTGAWTHSILADGIGQGYRHDSNAGKGTNTATFKAKLPKAGRYEVQIAYTPNGNRASNIPVTVNHQEGIATAVLNQKEAPSVEGHFHPVGTYEFGEEGTVTLSNEGTNGYVIIDAVRWLPAK